jgi:hypothetical protein
LEKCLKGEQVVSGHSFVREVALLWSVEEICETDCAQRLQFFKTIPSENGIEIIRRKFWW